MVQTLTDKPKVSDLTAKLTCLPGRIALWVPFRTFEGQFHIPSFVLEDRAYDGPQPLREATVISSGISDFDSCEPVYCRDGVSFLALDHKDYDWIPIEIEGRQGEVRIYGLFGTATDEVFKRG